MDALVKTFSDYSHAHVIKRKSQARHSQIKRRRMRLDCLGSESKAKSEAP